MRLAVSQVSGLFMLAWLTATAACQVVQVSGGTSTLDQSSGGQVSVRGPGYGGSLGGGSIGGNFYVGGHAYRQFERSTVSLGTEQIGFDLPTDVFESGHYLTGLGVAYSTGSDTSHTYIFAGSTASGYNSPFFNASAMEQPAVIVKAADKAGNSEVSALVLLAAKPTMLVSLAWKDEAGKTALAVTTGLGAAEPYSAISLSTRHRSYDLDASYIAASGKFRRALVKTPINSEPDRENIQLVVRLAPWAGFTLSRQNFLTPVYEADTNTRSKVTQATTNLRVAGINMAATLSESTDGSRSNLASFLSASRTFGGKTDVQVAYLVSRPSFSGQTSAFVSTVRQTLSPRWTLGGVCNSAGGQTSYGSNVAFLSNRATISADYEFFYVPARLDKPFERVVIVNVQLHLLGRVLLSGTNFVAPNGKLLYTTGGSGLLSHVAYPATTGGGGRDAIGRMVMRGRVITSDGEPVAGAALWIDKMPVYTDSKGRFEVREHKMHQHALQLRGDQFLEGGLYQTVTAPAVAWSQPMANLEQEQLFVVQRLPLGQKAKNK